MATFPWHRQPAAHSSVQFTLMHALAIHQILDMKGGLYCAAVHVSDFR